MKKLVLTLVICLGCMGVLGAQNIWKPINGTGILGVGPDGNIFAYSEYGELSRSQDEGETWQIVLGQETGFTGHINSSCFAVSHEGRICVFNDNQQTVVYSDDGGDTWQQTTSMSSCAMPDKTGLCAPTNDVFVIWAENGEINYSLDGGETWDGWIPDFMNADNGPAISDLLVNENGDVYLGLRTIGGEGGIFRSTLSDMQNWEIASAAGLAIMDMEFDPEGNVVACGWRTEGSIGFQQTPGFYLFDGTSLAIGDGGIVYTPHYSGLQAVLSYSTDHGEHFTEIGEHLPLVDIAPGGENGRLFKGYDNHLYFDGGGEYWKSISDADHITNDGNYVPLIHEGNDRQKWNVVYIGANENYPNDYFTEIQSIRDNINLDGVDYKLVWRESVHESKRIAGAVREEDKRMYFRRYWQQSYQDEVLLYDFNLTVGDTVSVGWGDYRLIVLEESQVQVNGTMRRQLGLAMYFDDGTTGEVEEYWIEGVGSTYGFLNSGYEGWVGAFVHLLCYHENGNLIWDNEAFDECVMNSDGAPATFAPQGAEWYFDVFNPWGTHPEYERFFVAGDTIIQDHQCSIIDQRFVDTGHDGGEYVYEEDNKVYWFNPTTNAFTTLYDFDAEAGESWDYEVGDCTHQVIVDSVGSATWNGHTYRTQWVRFYEENLPIYYSGKIMEGIGYERGLFPSIYVCNGLEVFDAREIEYLRCYVKDGNMLYHEGIYNCDGEEPVSSTFQSGNLLYSIISTDPPHVSVVGHVDGENAQGELFIPEAVDYEGGTFLVKEISERAFNYCRGLVSIDVPNMVTKIGAHAFHDCDGLQTVHLPDSLEAISAYMFFGCFSLSEISIPSFVREIGKSAFANCIVLTDIVVPNGVTVIGSEAFNACWRLQAITLPERMVSIGEYAFFNCDNLVAVILPEGLTTISRSLFLDCDRLESVVIPESVTSINEGAFQNCVSLDEIVIPNRVESIGNSAFEGCSNLGLVELGSSVSYLAEEVFLIHSLDVKLNLICHNTVPAQCESNSFPQDADLQGVIIVPCGFEGVYRQAWGEYWQFGNIEEDCGGGLVEFHGSEWYYEIENENGSITYQHLEYAADTTINNNTVVIIIRTNTLYDKSEHSEVTREYLYEEDGVVYWWNPMLQEFTVLYNYEAEVGDEWEVKVGTESITMHVDAVENIEYEGRIFRMLHVSDEGNVFSGSIVCGIGHLTSFFPERLMTRDENYRVEGMRCYWLDGELVFKYGDKDCDEVYEQYHDGIDEDGLSIGSGILTVYPNPTHGVLVVETRRTTSLPDQTYRIINLMGQTLMSGTITAETQQIDVTNLPEGMYFITIGDMTSKFVVNK